MRQAVILAGGQATRLRPYTDDRPKAMVEVAGVPVCEHQIVWLASAGVENVVMSVGYRHEVIQDRIGDGSRLGVHVTYAVEDTPLGRGGGMKLAAKRLPYRDEGWFALNGDVLAKFPVLDLSSHHQRISALATIALAPYRSNWGLATLDGDFVLGFVQSPHLPYWINGGIYCMEPEVIDLLPDKGDHEDTTFPELALSGRLGGYKIEGYWRGIDTVKDLKEANVEYPQELGE
ncbi:MAG TPA: nucleotidyltransferase family protein [Actinomycetota bacterium]|nr:nucleotidyltransferase family protein [Actinomycetota bacterium]